MKYYDNEFSDALVAKDLRRLVNQIWKLLPMKENEEDWQKQLDSVLIELRGLHMMFGGELDFLILISQLEGLHNADTFMLYRTMVFNAISTMTELINIINARKY